LNTAIGAGTLLANTADQNTATGAGALLSNTIGTANTANGAFTLFSNTTGNGNTANGAQALQHNTIGFTNTANGADALFSNTTGIANTATGFNALFNNTIGFTNTATGAGALFSNTTGGGNTGAGFQALNDNTSGSNNTGIGGGALFNNTTGNGNIALGNGAGIGVSTANNVIAIGAPGVNLGNSCYVGQIFGQPVDPASAVPVFVDSDGKLGTAFSSRRFKHDIKPMDKASEAILALKPVTFHYKNDTKDTPQFGLIAEDVAAVNPDLVVSDKNGEIYTVRYDAVNAMLLNEFLKEHRKVEELTKHFQATVARLDEQAAQIQKVSAQLEASKPAPQVVKNP
jgi:hypothetical protein